MDIESIKLRVERELGEPVAGVCLSLIKHMTLMPPDQLQRLTIPLLASFVNLPPQDALLQSAVTALTTVRDHPLTLYFLFLDLDDDREVEVSASEVLQSLNEGLFLHPRTGDAVAEFKSLLQPAYKLSEDFARNLEKRS